MYGVVRMRSRCIIARFAWSVIRAAINCNWSPTAFFDLQRFFAGSIGIDRRLVSMGFAALALVFWATRNKALVEGNIFNQPADLIYKMVVFLRLWRQLARLGDRQRIDIFISKLRNQCHELHQAT